MNPPASHIKIDGMAGARGAQADKQSGATTIRRRVPEGLLFKVQPLEMRRPGPPPPPALPAILPATRPQGCSMPAVLSRILSLVRFTTSSAANQKFDKPIPSKRGRNAFRLV